MCGAARSGLRAAGLLGWQQRGWGPAAPMQLPVAHRMQPSFFVPFAASLSSPPPTCGAAVDADPCSASSAARAGDVISKLVGIYGSKELFISEYRWAAGWGGRRYDGAGSWAGACIGPRKGGEPHDICWTGQGVAGRHAAPRNCACGAHAALPCTCGLAPHAARPPPPPLLLPGPCWPTACWPSRSTTATASCVPWSCSRWRGGRGAGLQA